ncbi:hypothetical protein DSECCO2_645490 [anaerobic digester metagenome]
MIGKGLAGQVTAIYDANHVFGIAGKGNIAKLVHPISGNAEGESTAIRNSQSVDA